MNNAQVLASLFIGGLTLGDRRELIATHDKGACDDSINVLADIIMLQVLELTDTQREAWVNALVKLGAEPKIVNGSIIALAY